MLIPEDEFSDYIRREAGDDVSNTPLRKERVACGVEGTMTPENAITAIEEYFLSLTPVRSKEGVSWSVGKRSLRCDGSNVEIHRVTGAPGPCQAVEEWLRYYGPSPSHGIHVGSVVAHRRLTLDGNCGVGVVLRIGKWCATIAYESRLPSAAPLACLVLSSERVSWTPEPEELFEDLDDPDYFCV